jgi:hypothetical protein
MRNAQRAMMVKRFRSNAQCAMLNAQCRSKDLDPMHNVQRSTRNDGHKDLMCPPLRIEQMQNAELLLKIIYPPLSIAR